MRPWPHGCHASADHRWSDRAALEAFRGAGVSDEQGAMIREARVTEFTAGDETSLR
ncbi:hypothetical protein ACIBQ0_13520 [Nocardia nova]|uniref:hypothetical protein n=1 Tax=Nocardia nova TaxID=37330 RepID=UPI003792B5D0